MFSCFEKHTLKSNKILENSSRNKKIYLAKKNFLVPSIRKNYLNLRKWSRNEKNFLETRNLFSLRKSFSIKRKLYLFWDIWKFFSMSLFFLFWEKYSDIFFIWEQISQIKKTFLSKFWGICSEYKTISQNKNTTELLKKMFVSLSMDDTAKRSG